jgi:protoporphyrinogen oxidase
MKDLGIYSKLHWVISEMGIFYQGKLHSVSDLLSLLKFPELSLSEKLRLAWSTFKCKYRDPSDWHDFENLSAQEWLTSLYGEHIYRIFYEFLLNLKFRSYAPKISAAWFWARINRLANSRTVTQKECLGYLEGGTKTFINALERAIRERGGEIYLKTPVAEVVVHEGLATGIRCDGKFYGFDHIISTVPIPVFLTLFPAMDGPYVNNLNSLNYIDVIVMVMHLSQRFSRLFWMNINDPRIDLAGIIEYTNINPSSTAAGDAILYIPQYLPNDHQFFRLSDKQLFTLYCNYLNLIRPDFRQYWVKGYKVFRTRFAQPICELGFSKQIPEIQTNIPNLYLTDSFQLHPDDRTVAGSTALGQKAVNLILKR